MFNRSRKVMCPECSEANFWKGDPKLDDCLMCRNCRAEITTYAEYIDGALRTEAERLLAEFTEASTAQDLAYLKRVLSQPQRATRP